MSFLRGFSEELIKTAKPGGRMAGLMRAMRLGRSTRRAAEATKGLSLGRAALLAGGAGAAAATGGEVYGKKKGKEKGYTEGTSDVEEVAMRARSLGRQEGVMAYHEALQARLRAAQGGK